MGLAPLSYRAPALTAYELQRAGIDCTLICDNMASLVMKQGKINACFVGCDQGGPERGHRQQDRHFRRGDLVSTTASPSTSSAPPHTIDFTCPDEDHIPIELRDGAEIKEKFFSKPSSLRRSSTLNPAFDVTDQASHAIVTEKGICYPPFAEGFAKLFRTFITRVC